MCGFRRQAAHATLERDSVAICAERTSPYDVKLEEGLRASDANRDSGPADFVTERNPFEAICLALKARITGRKVAGPEARSCYSAPGGCAGDARHAWCEAQAIASKGLRSVTKSAGPESTFASEARNPSSSFTSNVSARIGHRVTLASVAYTPCLRNPHTINPFTPSG